MSTRPSRLRTIQRVSVAFLAVAGAVSNGHAAESAEAEPSVVVSLLRCPSESFPLVALVDSLRVELAGTGLRCCEVSEHDAVTLPSDDAVHVVLEEGGECRAAPLHMRLTVLRGNGKTRLEREISLLDVTESALPRALALAVAELIRSPAQEPRNERRSEQLSPREPPPRITSNEPSRVPVTYALHAEAELRTYPARDTSPWGGRIRLSAYRSRGFAEADLGFSLFSTRKSLGELIVQSGSIGVGAGLRLATASLGFELGPRIEVGWARIRGETELARSVRMRAQAQSLTRGFVSPWTCRLTSRSSRARLSRWEASFWGWTETSMVRAKRASAATTYSPRSA